MLLLSDCQLIHWLLMMTRGRVMMSGRMNECTDAGLIIALVAEPTRRYNGGPPQQLSTRVLLVRYDAPHSVTHVQCFSPSASAAAPHAACCCAWPFRRRLCVTFVLLASDNLAHAHSSLGLLSVVGPEFFVAGWWVARPLGASSPALRCGQRQNCVQVLCERLCYRQSATPGR